jgi:hypothetical protein
MIDLWVTLLRWPQMAGFIYEYQVSSRLEAFGYIISKIEALAITTKRNVFSIPLRWSQMACYICR